jgi:hypothetical protein
MHVSKNQLASDFFQNNVIDVYFVDVLNLKGQFLLSEEFSKGKEMTEF